jgi:hypothetical protein|tara:strand:+ start:214 stop:600 length:387 start_codon:yes stop_codon:yes gene_type:complete
MSLSILPVNQVFGKYEQQARLADLNKKTPVKTIQMQVDRVSISPEARKMRAINAALEVIQASKKEPTTTLNIEGKSLPSSGEKMPSKDVDELLSSTVIVSEHFKNKADKAAAEEAIKKKEYDDQNTHF